MPSHSYLPHQKQWDYLVVADLDNTVKWDDQTFGVVLNALDKEDQWDAVAFSSTNYYDWWAARCDSSSKNCLSHKVCLDRREFPCIMETLQDTDTDHFRPVRSAFNGLAVYKRDAIGDCKYDAKNRDTTARTHKDCEHVGFHDCITANGARFMLNSGRLHTWWSNLGDEPEEESNDEGESKDDSGSEWRGYLWISPSLLPRRFIVSGGILSERRACRCSPESKRL
eukprot:s3641_g11.t1